MQCPILIIELCRVVSASLYDGLGLDGNLSQDCIVPEPAMLVPLCPYFSIKTKASLRAILRTSTKVRGATETAGCRSLKGVREEEKHGAQPEGRDSSESIDG